MTLNLNGSFTYTPDPDYNGPDSFTYQASDGAASSTPATVTIAVTGVNDEPSFTNDGPQSASIFDLTQTVSGWAAPSAGPADEQSVQTVDFQVSLSAADSTLFLVPPAIDGAGTLTYTPLLTSGGGTATVHVRAHDDGGTDDGGDDLGPDDPFTITLTNP